MPPVAFVENVSKIYRKPGTQVEVAALRSVSIEFEQGEYTAIMGASGTHGKVSVSVKITGQLSGLINIFILPLFSIVPALLYLKMRQFGGETLNDVMTQIEEVEGARSNWRQRMRTRLTVNTPHSRTPS